MISEGKSTKKAIQEFLEGIQEATDKKIHLTGILFGSSQAIQCVKP
jgi:hypothetical protein